MILVQTIYLIGPVILAGITNMVFVKLPLLKSLDRPIDNRMVLRDGERLFGDNKTWKGFLGMIAFTSLYFTLWSVLSYNHAWARTVSPVDFSLFDFPGEVLLYGGLWGSGYVLFELPNSFLKRRLRIAPGTNIRGFKGALFTFIDQADSVIGCTVFLLFFYRPTLSLVITIIVTGTLLHYVINILLYLAGLKKQAG